RLSGSRSAAFVIALVYVLLPNYSADRFWFAAFAAPLSIALCLASLLFDFSAVNQRGGALILRRAGSVTLAVLSLTRYEVALPFFFLSPLLVWYVHRQEHPTPESTSEPKRSAMRFWLTFGGINWIVLVAVAAFKAQTSPRLHAPRGNVALFISIVRNLF